MKFEEFVNELCGYSGKCVKAFVEKPGMTKSEHGFRFEALTKLFAFLYPHLLKIPKNAVYTDKSFSGGSIDGKMVLPTLSSIRKANIRTGGDKADLTFFETSPEKVLHVFSCKIGTHETDYDLVYIHDYHHTHYAREWKLKTYLVVPSSEHVKNEASKLRKGSRVLKEYLEGAHIIDYHTFQNAYFHFVEDFKKVDSVFETLLSQRSSETMTLYPHQLYLSQRLYEMITEEKMKNILLAMVTRSGKTYVSGKTIYRLFHEKYVKNVLFLSTTPKEQRQCVEELQKYSEFSEKNVNIVFLDATNRSRRPPMNKTLPTLYVASEQFLREKTGRKCRKKACASGCTCECSGCKKTKETCECLRFQPVEWFQKETIDLCLFDEVQHQGRTVLAHDALNTYAKNSIRVFLSGTADKVIQAYHISPEETLSWKTADFEDMKRFDNVHVRSQMIERNGPLFETMMCTSSFSSTQLAALYQTIIPSLETVYIGLTERTHANIQTFYASYPDEKRGWSPQGMLLLKDTDDVFQAESHLLSYLREIFGTWCQNSDEWYLSTSDTSMFSKIVSDLDTQTPRDGTPTLILTILPTQIRNQNIMRTSNALKMFMEKNNVFPHAHYICVNSLENGTSSSVALVEQALLDGKRRGKKYVVAFVAYQLNMSVTLKTCDVVVRMDNFEEQDRNDQINARCLTGDTSRSKKVGFVLEANLYRTCHTLLRYALDDPQNRDRSPSDALEYTLKSCQFKVDYTTVKQAVKMILDVSQKSILKSNYDRIKTLYFDLKKEDMSSFQKTFGTTKASKKKETDILPGIVAESVAEGVSREDSVSRSPSDKKKKEPLPFNVVKDVLLYLLPVYCLLGLESPNKSFLGIHRYLQTTLFKSYLLQLFSIWKWNTDGDIFKQIEAIYDGYLSKSTDFKCSFENILKSLSSCEDRTVLREWVDEHFMVHENEKAENAEVATPVSLRNDMLETVPTEFWSSPKKVLEPCCGKGGFLLDIIDLFMTHLPISDPEEKYKTIIEKCLFFADINPLNIYICRLLLDPSKKYKLNIFEGDSLSAFSDNTFDMVVGNPPYNSSGSVGTGNTIWQHFVTKGIEWLRPNGYLLYVHPPGWRKPNTSKGKFNGLFSLLTHANQMHHLSIHGIKDGMKTFKCGTRYDWYLVQKCKSEFMTVIVDEKRVTHEIDMEDWEWLPNHSFGLVQELLAYDEDETCPIIYSRTAYGADKKQWMSSEQTTKFKYPCVHSTPLSGVRYMYSSVNDKGHFGVSKVIFGESGLGKIVLDLHGTYGITHSAMGIEVDDDDEAKKLEKALSSEAFKRVIDACSWSSFRIDWNIFKCFKKTFYDFV
jgi:type I restriction-modification system DNA methylase subunit